MARGGGVAAAGEGGGLKVARRNPQLNRQIIESLMNILHTVNPFVLQKRNTENKWLTTKRRKKSN